MTNTGISRSILRFGPALFLAVASVGCAKQARPLTASSADQRPYALRYPDGLSGLRTEISTDEAQVETAKSDFQGYPDALSNPSWPDVLAVYQKADEAGKTGAYVQELEHSETVARFYVDEKDELNKRVGGAAQRAAKEKQCDVELYGPTSYALGKGFEERLRDRVRDQSEAFQYIDDHEDELGKKNRPKLEDQSDAISRASYLAHVAMPKARERLAQELDAASDVKKTLTHAAEDAHKVAEDPKTPPARRAKAKDLEQKAQAAAARVDGEAEEAKKLSAEMENREKAMRDKYEAAFSELKKAVETRAKAAH